MPTTSATKTASWSQLLNPEKSKPYFKEILNRLSEDINAGETIYPNQADMFNAFSHTPYSEVKVVILGQDPYHGPNQAHGLSFSVKKPQKIPPSLRNIYKELSTDMHITPPKHGDLTGWAKEGVLLLNASLTVLAGQPQSHASIGWSQFTTHIIDCVNKHPEPIVFMLWGGSAQQHAERLDDERHLILTAPHPSPLSCHRGFLGCHHFSRANTFLASAGRKLINWANLP